MVSQKITVRNESGIHARPASVLAKVAMRCSSDINIRVGNQDINPKSVLNLMAAAIKSGTEILVECTGEDEEADLQTLIDVITSGLES